eukprot:3797558-Prymnesium_polylepis.1
MIEQGAETPTRNTATRAPPRWRVRWRALFCSRAKPLLATDEPRAHGRVMRDQKCGACFHNVDFACVGGQ